MKVMLIDDEQPGLEEIAYLLGKYPDIDIAGAFNNPLLALEAIKEIKPAAVFLDIDMPYMNGLELALRIQQEYAGIIIIFVTAYSRFALDAFKAYPLDYILKPIKEARLEAAVEHMRSQYALLHPQNAASLEEFKITCFGGFEMVLPPGCQEMKWGTRRVRELFMYLIDRCGTPASKSEILQALFSGQDDKKAANNLYVTVYKLRSILDKLDPDRKLMRFKDDYSLDLAPGICDYTDFARFARKNTVISHKNAVEAARALNMCRGAYLESEDCPWTADTAALCEIEYERIALGLAGVHLSAGRFREAENVLSQLLLYNPFSEDCHLALLDIFILTRDDSAYTARYLEYTRILSRDLGTNPPRKYVEHYQKIIG